jgi:hypothetical protein
MIIARLGQSLSNPQCETGRMIKMNRALSITSRVQNTAGLPRLVKNIHRNEKISKL